MTYTTPPTNRPTLAWNFPLRRTHAGILLGNGLQGLMVWGDSTLNITVGRAGFWDHRGGNAFASRTTYRMVRSLLEAGDEAGLRRVFANPDQRPGQPASPTQIGGGRLELHFSAGFRPVRGELDTGGGRLRVTVADAEGRTAKLTIRQAMDQELAMVELDEAAHGPVEAKVVTTWDYIGDYLVGVDCQPPERWSSAEAGGFYQRLPEDDGLALHWQRRDGRLVVATALGDDAPAQAQNLAQHANLTTVVTNADRWWADYWRDVPVLHLPDPALQHAFDYGVYKLAGLTAPGGIPASLQGPWLEEYQKLPWSADYHFNINIQMIYWPCLAGGRWDHLWPLWEMILGWIPRLQENAARFFGAPDALMMPHAVDDRCAVVGVFWTGTIDQACTAWMAQLAWLHYRYSRDERVLREVAWPLLVGAFNGYWAMLERIDVEGAERLSLPVSVSPEYNAAGMDAWGRDASFQLAALHFLAQTLPHAAREVGHAEDPRWAEVRAGVPPYTLSGPPDKPRIALWQGQDLDFSHRHHSHLGAVYPFCTIDPSDPVHREVLRNTLQHWITRGAGMWTGWSVPWAAILCSRCGMPDAAVAWLHWWRELFTNEGHGTLHNAHFEGMTVFGPSLHITKIGDPNNHEVMQIEAGMGTVTALYELLVECRDDTIAVLPHIPAQWRDWSFDGVWAEGAFRVGATVAKGRTVEVRVLSTCGGPLTLVHGIEGGWTYDATEQTAPMLQIETRAGEEVVLRRAEA